MFRGDVMQSNKFKKFLIYLFWIALAEGIGFLAGLLSREGVRLYSETVIKPPLTPPAIVFPIVWTVLYALMGFAAARVFLSESSTERTRGLRLFAVQLVLNFCWPLLFFNIQAFGIAFFLLLVLWATVLRMIVSFSMTDKAAAFSQLPYIFWLTFAACLNAGVWLLNS